MNSKILRILISAGLLLCLKIPTLSAEAVFTVSASSAIGADIGVTELTGRVILTVSSGSTVAAPFVIDYSAPITNNAASEISILGTGGLVGIAPSPALDRTNNRIRIDVPEGGGAGSTIQITGVRVSLVGLDGTKVAATISSPLPTGNSILAEQRTVVVINSVMQPLVVDLGNNPIKIPNLSHDTVDTSFLITEQYATAFTSAVGNYGQTTATQVRINPFPSIPSGVTLTFAATAPSAATGAVFTTTSGQDETVPRSDGTTSVIYQFTGAGGSDNSIESFRFNVTASIHPPAGTGSITFQATLLPIGIAVPNSQSPSVDIPRYIERPVPDEADLQTDTVRLAFPFLSQSFSGAYTGIALTNPIPYRVKVSLTAYDSGGNLISGPGITNPVDLTMPRSGQYAKLASEIFGPTFNSSTAGTIVAQGKTSDLPGFYLAGGTIAGKGLDGATAGFSSVARWVFPTVFHQGPSPTTVLQMFNPGSEPANALLKLYDSTGSLKSTTSLGLAAGGTQVRDVADLFNSVDLNALSGGYVTGNSDSGLVVSENFGNDLDSNVLDGQLPVSRSSYVVPHFVTGGGYSSELSLLNMDPQATAQLTLTAFDNTGSAIGGSPIQISLPPGNQLVQAIDQVFPSLAGSFTTGYIRVDVATSYVGPFITAPPIVGSLRFTSSGGSTALPVWLAPSSDLVYAHVAQNGDYFTGVAMINTNQTALTADLQVLAGDGSSVGSVKIQLQPGQKLAKLLFELIPSSAGQLGGYVRIRSTLPMVSFSLFGTTDGKLLSAIPPQNVY